MKIFDETEIRHFLSKRDYDVRKSCNARWIDQKCTPDVVSAIADSIAHYVGENKNQFTKNNIWLSKFSAENISEIFKKPDTSNSSMQNEYDKLFAQPMKMLAYAGILKEIKDSRDNTYEVIDNGMLEYIALAEKFALKFLQLYIEKVLSDSGLLETFIDFYKNSTTTKFNSVKEKFFKFTVANTAIGGRTMEKKGESAGEQECGRIFTKVINPLAFKYNSRGTERGHLSHDKITLDMLMYNRDNFRDIYSAKPKGMPRKDYERKIKFAPNIAYFKYQSAKAKLFIKFYNQQYRDGFTEMLEPNEKNIPAVHIHHIFPESEFPLISAYYENLIALTPNQHLVNAHPKGKTTAISTHYQYQCLIAKTDRIKENLETPSIDKIYVFARFLFVIQVGLDDETYLQVENNDYNGIKAKLAHSYSAEVIR
jgi:hypothetical protein